MTIRQKIDLHLHTLDDPRDHHVFHTAEELIDKAHAQNFTALAITLHTRQFENERVTAYAAERGIALIPGVEQDVEGKHVLLLNFDGDTAHGIRTFADLRRAKRPDAMVIAAHPFYPNSVCLQDHLLRNADVFDAVEMTGFHHRWWNPNAKAKQVAKQLGLPIVANSDTHTLEQFGTYWTEVMAEPQTESILAALKQGGGQACGSPLALDQMGVIAYKVVARGYMPWVNYKRERGRI